MDNYQLMLALCLSWVIIAFHRIIKLIALTFIGVISIIIHFIFSTISTGFDYIYKLCESEINKM